jgi:hypothetical protein
MLRTYLPPIPPDARVVSPDLAVLVDEAKVAVFNASGPIFECDRADRDGLRLAAAMFSKLNLATPTALARALDMHPATACRSRQRFAEGGVEAVRARKRGPKGPSKLTEATCSRAQRLLEEGWSIRRVAGEVGVVEGTLRHAVKCGRLRRPQEAAATPSLNALPGVGTSTLSSPSERAAVDQSREAGVAVKRTEERALARVGLLVEAAPQFEAAEAVPNAGVLLAVPALHHEGLFEVGLQVYRSLSNGFFGPRSVLLTLAFMALLRIKTPEQLSEHEPGELGHLLGLDRVPEVKTLRRKLGEMGERGLAHTFMTTFTQRWATAEPEELGILYVDGHVRPYHGRTHVLPQQHVQQRGRPMPGTKDFHVNDRNAQPLFFVTAEATEGLLEMLDTQLLPDVRRLVGADRRVTIVFDREGWSPEMFAKWKQASFDVLTYRKGKMPTWRKESFKKEVDTVDGQQVEYQLAERKLTLPGGLKVREIRRRTDDGHQTSVVTTNEELSTLEAARRMFSRWRQENFFRYMRHEFALDHLCTHEVDPADPKRLVACPERKALEKKLKALRASTTRLIERRVRLKPGKKARVRGKAMTEDELDGRIARQELDADRLAARIAKLPKEVPLEQVLDPKQIVQLERERKMLVDVIKLTAYRAETSLARLVEPIFARHEDEARKFLKSIFQATADLVPDTRRKLLTVRFHGLSSPRATRALGQLCSLVNELNCVYPGTDLTLRFDAPALQE